MVNRDGVITFAAQCEGGLTPEKLVGYSIYDRMPANAAEVVRTKLPQVFASGAKEQIRLSAPDSCGKGGSVEIRLIPLPNQGKPLESVAVSFRRLTLAGEDQRITLDELPCERGLRERQEILTLLQQSEERLRRLAEASAHGIAIIQNHRVVFANAALAAIAAASQELILGRSTEELVKAFVDPEYSESLMARLSEDSDAPEHRSPYELRIRVAGEYRWIEVAVIPVTFNGSKALQVAIIDITTRREAEEALRESEERYRTLVENAQNAIVSMEYDGTITFLNPMAAQMLGGKPDEYIGQNVMNLFPPDKAARHLAAVQRVIDAGKGVTVENLTVMQGQPRWQITSIHPINGHNGRPRSAFLISTDITENKQANEKLSRERDFNRLILQTANSLIFCLDEDAHILLFNEECERVTGYKAEEVLGKRWPDIFIPERFKHDGLDDFGAWVHAHPADRREEPILTKSGEERIILWSNSSFVHPETGQITAIAIGYDITQNKLAEERLRESENRFKETADLLPQMIFEVDLDGQLTFINQAGPQMFGYAPDSVEQYPNVLNVIHPDDRERAIDSLFRLRSGGESRGNEYRAVRADGSVFPVLVYTTGVRREGKVVGYRGMLVDITERKQAEEQLRQSQEAFRDLVENVDDVLYTLDSNFAVTYVSPAVKNVLGYEPEELMGVNALSLIHPEDLPEIERAVQDTIGGRQYPSEYRMIAKSGEARWVRTQSRAIFEGDKFVGVRGVLADIDERKRTENELHESRRRFERVAQQSREMVWEVAPDGIFTYVSQACEEILGYRPEEMIGKLHFYDLQAEAERERFKTLSLAQIGRQDSFHNQVNKAMTKDGRTVWFLTSGSPVLDADGNLKGYVGADLDITERIEMEKDLYIKDRALATAANAITMADLEGRITYANEALAKLFGYTVEELIGMHVGQLGDNPVEIESVMSELRNLGQIDEELQGTRKDGSFFDMHLFASAVTDSTGNPIALLVTVVDITERKKAQEAIRISENRFRALYRSSPLPTFTWQRTGSDFILIDFNDAASKITEGGIGNFRNVALSQFYANRPDLISDIHACFENQATIVREMKYSYVSTGRTLDLSVRYSFVPPDLVLIVTEDITQRKHDEEAVRLSEERFRAIYEGSPLPMVLFQWRGDDLVLIGCNEATNIASEGRFANLINSPAALVLRDEPETLELLRDCYRKRTSLKAEYDHVLWGTDRGLSVLASIAFIPPDLVLIQAQDMTERKKMEQELRAANQQLELERENLNERNIALKVLIEQGKEETRKLKQIQQENIDELVRPIVARLRERARVEKCDRQDLQMLDNVLSDIASTFISDIEARFSQLTPRETEICSMIRNGRQTKEIGEVMGISDRTVEKFRQKIRRKLGISGKHVNITTFLRSISQKD